MAANLQAGSFLSTGDGNGYFNVGGARSRDRGRAVSKPFVLPNDATGLSFLRCGGANAPSGVTVTNVQTSEVLCTATDGTNTGWFFKDFCAFEDESMGGQTVEIKIEDVQPSNGKWGKVFVDKLRIELSSGEVVPIPAPAGNANMRLPTVVQVESPGPHRCPALAPSRRHVRGQRPQPPCSLQLLRRKSSEPLFPDPNRCSSWVRPLSHSAIPTVSVRACLQV